MAISLIRVTFDPDNSELDFVLQGSYPSGVEWFVEATGPFGTIKSLANFGTPDAVGASTALTVVSADPLQAGEYTFKVYAWDLFEIEGQRAAIVSQSHTVCYEPERGYKLSVSDNCVELDIRDNTEYPTLVSGFSRSGAVSYPVIAGVPTPPDETFTSPTVALSMGQPDGKVYEFVDWQVKAQSSGRYSFASGVWDIRYDITFGEAVVSHYVQCSLDLCSVVACVDNYWANLTSKACQMGGISKLPTADFDRINSLIGDLALYAHYVNCNNRAKSVEYYDRIKKTLGADCTVGDAPRAISSAVPGHRVWYPVEADEMDSSHQPTPLSPLSATVANGVMVFKGDFQGGGFSETGVRLIKKDFFDRIGVSIANTNTGLLVVKSPGPDSLIGIIFPVNGEMWLRTFATVFDTSSDMSIQGSFIVEAAP